MLKKLKIKQKKNIVKQIRQIKFPLKISSLEAVELLFFFYTCYNKRYSPPSRIFLLN